LLESCGFPEISELGMRRCVTLMPISQILVSSADHRRALALLAWYGEGSTKRLLVARGLNEKLIDDLLDAGLASTIIERMDHGRRPVEVSLVRITEAGQRALMQKGRLLDDANGTAVDASTSRVIHCGSLRARA